MENMFILLKSIWERSYYLKKCVFWSLYIKGNPFQVYNWFRSSHLNATFILVFWEGLCQKSPSSSMPFTRVLFSSLKICSCMLIIFISHRCKADSSNQCFKALTGSKVMLFALGLGNFPYYWRIIIFSDVFVPVIMWGWDYFECFGSEHLLSHMDFSLMWTTYSMGKIKSEPWTKCYPT